MSISATQSFHFRLLAILLASMLVPFADGLPAYALQIGEATELDDLQEAEEDGEEFEGEIRQEIAVRLEEAFSIRAEAAEQSAIHRRRKEVAETQIRYLNELKSLLRKAEAAERQLEQRNPSEEELGRTEVQLAFLEIELEERYVQLEICDRQLELLDLQFDLLHPSMNSELKQLKELLEVIDGARAEVSQMFRAFRNADEERGERIAADLEQMEGRADEQIEILRLKVELFFAREKGADDEIRELQEELRLFGAEFDPDDGPEGEDGREEVSKLPPIDLPPPIQVSNEEKREIGKLEFAAKIEPLLGKHCGDCHAGPEASGDLDIHALMKVQPFVMQRDHWLNVIQQIKVRSMPPADYEQPSDFERKQMLAWLQNAIENFDYETVRRSGREPTRRLTHEEYNNTIRDLFGMDLRPADRFPADMTASSGFRNSANSLFIQPVTMERYLNAAESVVTQVQLAGSKSRPFASWIKQIQAGEAEAVVAIRDFANRAYRRRVSAEEEKQLVEFFAEQTAAGSSAEEAFAKLAQTVLVSPSFLMRNTGQPNEPGLVSDFEMASRLSYFLWASMPDDELFRLAAQGRLQDPKVLRKQVSRMLTDPKAQTLGSEFAAQWLGIVNLKRVPRDQIDNPWATDSLFQALEDESALFFHSLVVDNAKIEQFVDAKYTYLNEELARHYRIPGVKGKKMRRVELKDSSRGGILGHASVLTITSFPHRTSPVVRGNWILSELLGTPPPPPPPNVSEFDERIENRRLSQRQKLELHRRNPNCYACHSEIDPLGFALEKYEEFGRLRDREDRREIDTTGKLPSGRIVKGLEGLRQALVTERRDDLVEQIARKMFTYALGRQLNYYDEAAVRDIISHAEKHDRRLQPLIEAIVLSDSFRKIDYESKTALGSAK